VNASRFGLREARCYFGLFDYHALCVVGPYARLEGYMRWKLGDESFVLPATAPRGRCFHRPGYVPVIWIPRAPRTPREYGTLAHEVTHAVRLLMDWAGVPMTADTEEVQCHAVGHAMTAFLEGLRR
jgi:hypothetical protein